ncbi:MAG: DNA cytosine methyltransferase [Prevotella sp.]|nr:DNA cytosine methyltransferase [Prevotella sp.]MBQ6211177.1 DNA cytosine methyltransferase [Prevotella sp.]
MKIPIEEQNNILYESIRGNVKLWDNLAAKHYCYDDLQYNDGLFFEEDNHPFAPIILMEDLPQSHDVIPAVSFFSGAGGLDTGFRYAGFNNIIGIEHTELFCNTLRKNNPSQFVIGPPYYEGDISKREEVASLLRANGVNEFFNGVFHGGPPCQSFSIAANQRFNKDGEHFKRIGFEDEEKGTLIFDYIWFIQHFKPLAFLIENVSGIMECDPDGRIRMALDNLRKIGYDIKEPQVLDAAYYGVPQHRKRWIVMGTRGSRPIEYPTPQMTGTPCGYVFMRSLKGVDNHVTRKHNAESVIRYIKLGLGCRDQKGRVDRLDPFKPSKTVVAGGLKGGGRSHLHPFVPRTISVRECARLQTFPDNYIFTGTPARQFTQVGNAVPPMLAYKLAIQIKKSIMGDYQGSLNLS